MNLDTLWKQPFYVSGSHAPILLKELYHNNRQKEDKSFSTHKNKKASAWKSHHSLLLPDLLPDQNNHTLPF